MTQGSLIWIQRVKGDENRDGVPPKLFEQVTAKQTFFSKDKTTNAVSRSSLHGKIMEKRGTYKMFQRGMRCVLGYTPIAIQLTW